MDPLVALQLAARRLVAIRSRDLDAVLVYQVHRVDPRELLGLGLADLPGAREAIAAVQNQRAAQDRALRMADATNETERRIVDEELRKQQAHLDSLRPPMTLEQAGTVLAAFDAILCGAVEAVGFARDGTAEGLLPVGSDPDQVCVPFEFEGRTVAMRPVRLVLELEPGTPNQMLARSIDAFTRGQLAAAVLEASGQGVRRKVETFRGQPDAAGAAGRVGKKVRTKADGAARARR